MSSRLVTFAHISDTHLHADPTYTNDMIDFPAIGPVSKMIDFINALSDVDFVLHTGDVMHHPQAPEEYAAIKKVLDKLKVPVYYIPGNHDHVGWMQQHLIGRASSEITSTYDTTFEFNGVQFILLDSHTPPEIGNAVGVVSKAQLDWLDNLLDPADTRPLVVAVHHHTLPLLAPWLDRIGMVNGEDLHDVLLQAKTRLRGVFAGHIHETLITVRDGISYYTTQSGWYQTRTYHAQQVAERDQVKNPGFNMVTLTEQDTFVRVIRIPT
jgi:Icc protein